MEKEEIKLGMILYHVTNLRMMVIGHDDSKDWIKCRYFSKASNLLIAENFNIIELSKIPLEENDKRYFFYSEYR